MSAAMEAGDETFTRTVLKPSPPGLDYKCGCCGKTLKPDDYSTYINAELKLVITATHCNRTAQFRVYMAMGGTLFKDDVFPLGG